MRPGRAQLQTPRDRALHEQDGVCSQLPPISERHITAQIIGSDHSGVIHRVLRSAKLRRVTEFRLFEVEDRSTQLDRGRDNVDALINVGFADGLATEDPTIGFAKDEFDVDWLRSRKIARVVAGMQINLLVIISCRRAGEFSR